MTHDAQPWPRGYCEAGIAAFPAARKLKPCSKRGRWLVNGVILCGGCRRALEAPERP